MTKKTVFVVAGITGDLAEKKLMPAFYGLAKRGALASDIAIIGTTRRDTTADEIIARLETTIGQDERNEDAILFVKKRLEMLKADTGIREGIETLKEKLASYGDTNHIYYLSLPPSVFPHTVHHLAEAGLNSANDRLLIEKPFGHDSESAEHLTNITDRSFEETAIYRIDHYLAKPGVRSLNTLAAGLDVSEIQQLKVVSLEALDIQGRADFYEQTGAMRDLIQSHLVQVLASLIMREPLEQNDEKYHENRLTALQALTVTHAKRAQYDGYVEEVGEDTTTTETYAELTLSINDARFDDVTAILETGKAMPAKVSSVTIGYKDNTENTLDMNANPNNDPDAYEQVILDAIAGERRLFLTSAEVKESWRIVENTLQSWSGTSDGMLRYQKYTSPTK